MKRGVKRFVSLVSVTSLMAVSCMGVLPSLAAVEKTGNADSEWEEIQDMLAQYTAEWTEPTYEGLITDRVPHTALLGNGDVGVASGGDAYSKNFYISKSDFWGYQDGPKAIGGVLLKAAQDAPQGPVSLTLNKPVKASTKHPELIPERAVNGKWASGYEGWVSDLGNPQWLEVDLEKAATFDRIVVRHDAAARPAEIANTTMAFSVEVRGTAADEWTPVYTTDNNHDSTTDVTLEEAVTARYVRLYITKGTQETTQDSRENPRARIGQFELYDTSQGEGDAPAPAADFYEAQDILNARILTDMSLGGVPVHMETKMMAADNLLVTKLTSQGEQDVEMIARAWAKSDNASLPVTASAANGRATATRAIKKSNAGDKESFTTMAAITTQVVGAPVTATANHAAGTADLAFTLPAGKTVYMVTAVGGGGQTYDYQNNLRGEAPQQQAADLLDKADDEAAIAALVQDHADWWKEYWSTATISLDSRDERLQTIQKYYYAAQYQLGCTLREGKTAPGLYGIWHTTDNPSWRSDYHLNYNFISTFYGLATNNRTALLLPAVEAITGYMEAGQANAATIQRFATEKNNEAVKAFVESKIEDGSIDAQNGIADALLYPVGIGPWGMKLDPSYHNQTLNAAFSAYPLIQYYEYTQDDDFLKDVLYEYLKPVLTFLEAWVVKNEDGGYDIYAGYNEGSWALNSAVELACYKNCLRYAIMASEKFEVDATRRAVWQDLLAGLADQPTATFNGKTIYALAEKEYKDGEWVDMSNPVPGDGNALTLESIIPGEVLGYYATEEELEILHNTVEAFIDRNAWGSINNFPKIFATAVNVRYDINTIIDNFTRTINQQMQQNLMIDDNVHGIEKAGATEAVHNMLLLSDQGVIKVFPNWLPDRDASFTGLREKGAFVMSAAYDSAKQEVSYVDITSEAGKTVTIASPWVDMVVTDDTGKVIPAAIGSAPNHEDESTYTFDTERGTTYHLTKGPKAQQVDKTMLRRQIEKAESGALHDNVFTPDSLKGYKDAVLAAKAVLNAQDVTQGNVDMAVKSVQQAFSNLEMAPDEIARFSDTQGTYTVDNTGTTKASLYTDWKTLDGGTPLDLSTYDRRKLYLKMGVYLTKEETALSDGELFNGGMVKLRSIDENGENNIGWGLGGRGFGVGENSLSICLADEPSSATGIINWSKVNRLNVYIDSVGSKEGRFSMTLSDVVIVDTTLSELKKDLLKLWNTDVDESGYTPDTVTAYRAAIQQAQAVINNLNAEPDDVQQAVQALESALKELEPAQPDIVPGDVDGQAGITAADALLVLQAATHKIILSDLQTQAADVDGEEGITAADALLVLQYATRKIEAFPMS